CQQYTTAPPWTF
nr:immunoglobulin light chain junction region [Macaca mulatta]MOX47712.1 immunoglobulin light chain junction region [Macaca mulatta]MOX48079.1 immunoglobulin light chain junction region [Macaca mulatta]MOX48629.1 immunoglobulin light chain junction region [Macaca mulatta]MOX49046.1 immunoglobulin light chain junction region [Macaca mulatta]